jgi:hypothetical protein
VKLSEPQVSSVLLEHEDRMRYDGSEKESGKREILNSGL